jgi:Flp pilus assembly protein TadG
MVHCMRRLGRRDDGAVAIITALLSSMVFIGLCALVVNLGMARDTRRQAQNAADASALAAGNQIYLAGSAANFDTAIGLAVSAAKTYAFNNYGVTASDWSNSCTGTSIGYVPPGGTPCISFDSKADPKTIRVTIPVRQVATPFAGIWGTSQVPVSAMAEIQVSRGDASPCGLCVTGEVDHTLNNGNIMVSGAGVAFNGNVDTKKNGGITDITVSGGSISVEHTITGSGSYSPTPRQNQPKIDDPLINLTMPDYSSLTAPASGNSCTGGPGIYAHLTENCSPAMRAGLYVLTGTTSVSGNSNSDIVANGVTLYFVCGTPSAPRACHSGGEVGGQLNFTGNGSLTITAPTTGPTAGHPEVAGLAIVADRNNTGVFDFKGNGANDSSGTIYAASGTLNYRGNGAGRTLYALVVAKDLTFNGNPAQFNSTYAKGNNVLMPVSGLHLSR